METFDLNIILFTLAIILIAAFVCYKIWKRISRK